TIFNAPRTPYVARFIGGQNVLSGTVESLDGDIAALRDVSGAKFAAPMNGRRPGAGQQLFFAVRRDSIKIARANQDGNSAEQVNTVRGKVHAIEYQGSYVKLTIDLLRPEEFVANVSDVEFHNTPVEIGEEVIAKWRPEHVHLLETDSRTIEHE